MSIRSKQLRQIKDLAFKFAAARDPSAAFPLTGEHILTAENGGLDHAVIARIQSQLTYMWSTGQYPVDEDAHYDNVVYFLANVGYYESTCKALVAYGLKRAEEILGCGPDGAGVAVHDFGGGVGLSTLDICQRWPGAAVHYSNVDGIQCDFMELLASEFDVKNLTVERVRPSVSPGVFPKVDVALALDVFEHIREPVPVLSRLLDSCGRVYVDNSAFGFLSEGHYQWYLHEGRRLHAAVSGSRARKLSQDVFPDRGPVGIKQVFYDRIERDFTLDSAGFNQNPQVYVRRSE